MVKPVNSQSSPITTPSVLSSVRGNLPALKPSVNQTDLITQMEQARNPKPEQIKDLKEQTDTQAKTFTKKASLYTTVNLLHSWCNVGSNHEDDDSKFRLVVKDLSKHKNPGFWTIRSAMRKYFKKLSFVRMFFLYYLFIGWLPELYIKSCTDKILDFSRHRLKEGDNLPALGSKMLGSTNTYLANYNRTIQRFRDDPNNPIGARDTYVKSELHKPEMLGYKSTSDLHKRFALAASREDTRPAFRFISNPIKKFQLLDFDFLKRHASIVRTALMPITIILGIVPYIAARIVEFPFNRVIKIAHSSLIKFFMPSVIKNTLEAVSQPGFSHAINCFLCDVLQDLAKEMKKKPEEKSIDEIPNVVNEALSQDIRKFSELLYTLLKNEPYKTQDDLQYLKNHGPDPKSTLERVLKLVTSKGYIDRSWITSIFVGALHSNIIDGFNLIFAQPEKLEEYLCNLMLLMNKVFDYVPDPNTDEGRAVLEEQKEKQKRRIELVDDMIAKGINLATDDVLNEGMYMLSRHQRENLLVSYRRVEKKARRRLPDIGADASDILNTSNYVHQSSAQARLAKEDIQRAMRDIERLFIAVNNVMTDENGPVKAKMKKHLKTFLRQEETLKDSVIQINELHDTKQGLRALDAELRQLKATLDVLPTIVSKQTKAIEVHLQRIREINKNHQFDALVEEYQKLGSQLVKINRHADFTAELEKILSTSYFSNSILLTLARAQKEYLQKPNSSKKEQNLVVARNKMQLRLKQLADLGEADDVQEIRLAMKKILEAQRSEQVSVAYKNVNELIRKKLSKHRSLFRDERAVLPRYYDKCKTVIAKHRAEIPSLIESTHASLIKHAEKLTVTVEQMQQSLGDVGTQNFADKVDGFRVTQLLGSIASGVGRYVGWVGSPVAAGLAVLPWVPTAVGMGLRKGASLAAVPLAKATADSGWGGMTNQPFYEGLIHAYMRQFIDYVKETKK